MNAPSKEQNRLGALALAATVVAGVGVLWWRFNAVPANPIMARLSDLVNYYVPMTELVMRRLGAGEIPLWNPHACAGIPLLATMQIGALYPGTWLALALPAHQALSLLMFVECALSGWFMALLLRSWGCDGFAAATGAILFVATCVLGQTFWPPHVSTILWLPWLLLCVEKLASRWSGRWALGLSAGVALQILAGAPQYLLYTLQLVVPVGLLRLLQARKTQSEAWADLAARGLGIATAAALGAGLAAAQLLPTLELTANSARETLSPASVHYLNIWDRHPSSDVLRNLLDPSAKLPTFEAGDGSGYLGIPLLIGFALGVFAGFRRPLVWLLLAIGALTLILSDGYFGWGARIYPLYASLPVVGAFRTPERLRLTTFLCLTIVAAFGFDQLGRRQEGKRRSFQLVAVGASLAVAAGMIGEAGSSTTRGSSGSHDGTGLEEARR